MSNVVRSRFGGSKVKSGCITCKARHVKCDEARPTCGRCFNARKICEGYESSHSSSMSQKDRLKFIIYSATAPPSSGLSLLPGITARQQRCFNFFRLRTSVELAGPFESDLWSVILLQTAHSEPAVIDAVIALGALHEIFCHAHDAHAATSEYALLHYGKAIKRIINLTDANLTLHTDVILMACIMFCVFESLRGHYKAALMHLSSGINIIVDRDRYSGGLRDGSLEKEVLIPIFVRLENQATESGQTSLIKSSTRPIIQRHFSSMPQVFKSLREAHNAFDNYISCLFHMLDSNHEEPASLPESMGNSELENLTMNPYLWHLFTSHDEKQASISKSMGTSELGNSAMNPLEHFNTWCATFDASGFSPTHPAVLILRVHRLMLSIILSVNLSKGELIWDPHLSQFQSLLDLVQQIIHNGSISANSKGHPSAAPTFACHLGLLPPLYFTCTRCRDPLTRRRALRILKNSKRKEGIWDSEVSATILNRIIELEERDAIEIMRSNGTEKNSPDGWVVESAEQVPESARIQKCIAKFGIDREATIEYLSSGSKGAFRKTVVKDSLFPDV